VAALQHIPLAETVRFERPLVVACRFDADALKVGTTSILELDGECHKHFGPSKTLHVECLRTSTEMSVSATVYLDSSKPRQTTWHQLTPGRHHLVLSFTRAQGPKSVDAQLLVYLDGQLWPALSNLPIYWRHHPSQITVDTTIVGKTSVIAGTTLPVTYMGPVVRRRHIRRKRR